MIHFEIWTCLGSCDLLNASTFSMRQKSDSAHALKLAFSDDSGFRSYAPNPPFDSKNSHIEADQTLPQCKRCTLSKLARRPMIDFAWASRDFLQKWCVSGPVCYGPSIDLVNCSNQIANLRRIRSCGTQVKTRSF
jgi:hypothetical protein